MQRSSSPKASRALQRCHRTAIRCWLEFADKAGGHPRPLRSHPDRHRARCRRKAIHSGARTAQAYLKLPGTRGAMTRQSHCYIGHGTTTLFAEKNLDKRRIRFIPGHYKRRRRRRSPRICALGWAELGYGEREIRSCPRQSLHPQAQSCSTFRSAPQDRALRRSGLPTPPGSAKSKAGFRSG